MKKIISYSLFGNNKYYLDGAVINAEMVNDIFPGWVCRFYIDHNVSPSYIKKLEELGSEIVLKKRRSKSHFEAISWRFEAASNSDIMICRDTDSILLERDKIAVEEWLNSNKDFHIIRDYTFPSARIMGGIWGCRNGILKNINYYLDKWSHFYFADDMVFLNLIIYPLIKHTTFIHDQYGLQFTDEIIHKINYPYDFNNYIGAKM